MTERSGPAQDARRATLAMLTARAPGATICPSEVARALAAATGDDDWRAAMPDVHAAVDVLMADGLIRLSWKGATLAVRDGPYRIARANPATVSPATWPRAPSLPPAPRRG